MQVCTPGTAWPPDQTGTWCRELPIAGFARSLRFLIRRVVRTSYGSPQTRIQERLPRFRCCVVSDNAGTPANLCLFFGWVESAEFGNHFGEAVAHASEEATGRIVGDRATEHFQHVLGGAQEIK